jgi:hypothetical protein
MSTVSVNNRPLGKGLGPNKKQAKFHASIQALKNLCPGLLEEWKVKVKELGQDPQPASKEASPPKIVPQVALNPEG